MVTRCLLPGLLSLSALLLAQPLAGAALPYGVNSHAPEGAALATAFDRVHEAHIGFVRIDFLWSAVEPSPGVYDWHVYDAIAGAARARGLGIFATIASTPAWATDGAFGSGVPRSSADWSDICFRAAQRYAGSIDAWGMWNEPNLTMFWAGTRQQYIDVILKPGADAVHAANPSARVAGPELAHLVGSGALWHRWLMDVLTQAGSRLDVVTHHVYDSASSSGVARRLETPTFFGNDPAYWDIVNPSVKEVLTAAGWLGKPFWLTETGWPSDVVGEASQATQYTGVLNDWCAGLASRAWVSRIFTYELADDPTAGVPKWGILRADLSRKPAFEAYRQFIEAHASGDANGDGEVSVADVFVIINYIFASGAPRPLGPSDANGDGSTDIGDVFYLINFIYANGPPPVS